MAEAKAATDAKDLARAVELYKKAYANKEPHAAEQLARLYLDGGEGAAVDYAAARLWAQKSAERGRNTGIAVSWQDLDGGPRRRARTRTRRLAIFVRRTRPGI